MAGPEDAELRARALSFGSVAAGYAAFRPGYPPDVVASLVGDRPGGCWTSRRAPGC
jgi:hypothetical protein